MCGLMSYNSRTYKQSYYMSIWVFMHPCMRSGRPLLLLKGRPSRVLGPIDRWRSGEVEVEVVVPKCSIDPDRPREVDGCTCVGGVALRTWWVGGVIT